MERTARLPASRSAARGARGGSQRGSAGGCKERGAPGRGSIRQRGAAGGRGLAEKPSRADAASALRGSERFSGVLEPFDCAAGRAGREAPRKARAGQSSWPSGNLSYSARARVTGGALSISPSRSFFTFP